jgi:hypothetical protein
MTASPTRSPPLHLIACFGRQCSGIPALAAWARKMAGSESRLAKTKGWSVAGARACRSRRKPRSQPQLQRWNTGFSQSAALALTVEARGINAGCRCWSPFICNQADDFPRNLRPKLCLARDDLPDQDSFPDRVLALEVEPRHCFVDHHHRKAALQLGKRPEPVEVARHVLAPECPRPPDLCYALSNALPAGRMPMTVCSTPSSMMERPITVGSAPN